jgi:TldD protein
MLRSITFSSLLICLLSLSSLTFGQQTLQKDTIFKAMEDELTRSMNQLRLKDLDKPYFIEYAVEDGNIFSTEATFGALIESTNKRNRNFHVSVRVGSYELDNTGFLGMGSYQQGGGLYPLVIEDDYFGLRYDMWLATDQAYKNAVQQLANKKTYLNGRVKNDTAPDFSREEAVVSIAPFQRVEIDRAKWEKEVKELSAIFKKFPGIQSSRVAFQIEVNPRYLVNSEGTRVYQPGALIAITVSMSAQTADGNWVSHYLPIFAPTFAHLPSREEMIKTITQSAEELQRLAKAPVFEGKYIGPVLLTEQASAEIFSQLLTPHLSGERPPLAENEYLAGKGNALIDRFNRLVLPNFLSVYDDPTQETFRKQPLIGSYRIDDQGVPAQKVSLIENGILKGFLMSRRPGKEISKSNGHGRAPSIGNVKANIGNLFIETKDGKSYDELKQELIKACKAQSLPYGILIKALGTNSSPDGYSYTDPVLAYKVYVEDGREELVRGVEMEDLSVKTLRDIIAAGNEGYVYNLMTGGSYNYVITASIIAPSILIEEIELKKEEETQQKPTILTHPYFSK